MPSIVVKLFGLRSFAEKIIIIFSLLSGLVTFVFAWSLMDSANINWILSAFLFLAILPSLIAPRFLANSSNDPEYLSLFKIAAVVCVYVFLALLIGYGIVWLRRQVLGSKAN